MLQCVSSLGPEKRFLTSLQLQAQNARVWLVLALLGCGITQSSNCQPTAKNSFGFCKYTVEAKTTWSPDGLHETRVPQRVYLSPLVKYDINYVVAQADFQVWAREHIPERGEAVCRSYRQDGAEEAATREYGYAKQEDDDHRVTNVDYSPPAVQIEPGHYYFFMIASRPDAAQGRITYYSDLLLTNSPQKFSKIEAAWESYINSLDSAFRDEKVASFECNCPPGPDVDKGLEQWLLTSSIEFREKSGDKITMTHWTVPDQLAAGSGTANDGATSAPSSKRSSSNAASIEGSASANTSSVNCGALDVSRFVSVSSRFLQESDSREGAAAFCKRPVAADVWNKTKDSVVCALAFHHGGQFTRFGGLASIGPGQRGDVSNDHLGFTTCNADSSAVRYFCYVDSSNGDGVSQGGACAARAQKKWPPTK